MNLLSRFPPLPTSDGAAVSHGDFCVVMVGIRLLMFAAETSQFEVVNGSKLLYDLVSSESSPVTRSRPPLFVPTTCWRSERDQLELLGTQDKLLSSLRAVSTMLSETHHRFFREVLLALIAQPCFSKKKVRREPGTKRSSRKRPESAVSTMEGMNRHRVEHLGMTNHAIPL